MNSTSQLSDILNHRIFSERQLARVDHMVFAKIEHYRLYMRVMTRGKVPKEWFQTLQCSVSDPKRIYVSETAIEDVLEIDGQTILVSAIIPLPVIWTGDIPNEAVILLKNPKSSKTFDLGGFIAAKP